MIAKQKFFLVNLKPELREILGNDIVIIVIIVFVLQQYGSVFNFNFSIFTGV